MLIALPSFKFLSTSFEEAAADLIESELHFLKLDKKGIAQYVKDYSRYKNKGYKLSVRGYAILGVKASKSGKVNQLVSNYLLSTDFFMNKMDEGRVINYVGIYDPYQRPCAHPFSHTQYAEAT